MDSTWRNKARILVNPQLPVKAIMGIGSTKVLKRGERAHAVLDRTFTIPNEVAEKSRGKITLCATNSVFKEHAIPKEVANWSFLWILPKKLIDKKDRVHRH